MIPGNTEQNWRGEEGEEAVEENQERKRRSKTNICDLRWVPLYVSSITMVLVFLHLLPYVAFKYPLSLPLSFPPSALFPSP